MASDLLFGWVLGLFTVIIPWLSIRLLLYRQEIRRLTKTEKPQTLPMLKKKRGLFGWLKKSYNTTKEA